MTPGSCSRWTPLNWRNFCQVRNLRFETIPDRGFVSRQLRQCQQLIDAESKLKAFLAGKGAPADAATQVHMADLAQQPFNRLTLTAARLYRDAFARQPRFADALRYNAACCA